MLVLTISGLYKDLVIFLVINRLSKNKLDTSTLVDNDYNIDNILNYCLFYINFKYIKKNL